jgi:hypothetical protein
VETGEGSRRSLGLASRGAQGGGHHLLFFECFAVRAQRVLAISPHFRRLHWGRCQPYLLLPLGASKFLGLKVMLNRRPTLVFEVDRMGRDVGERKVLPVSAMGERLLCGDVSQFIPSLCADNVHQLVIVVIEVQVNGVQCQPHNAVIIRLLSHP